MTRPAATLPPAGLAALIDREAALANELMTLLEAESRALQGRDAEAIVELAGRKQALVEEMNRAGAEITALLREAGIEDESALERRLAEHAELGRSWRGLRDALAACRDANTANGGAIRLLERFNGRLLELMQGTGPQQSLYDNGGRSRRLASNRYATSA